MREREREKVCSWGLENKVLKLNVKQQNQTKPFFLVFPTHSLMERGGGSCYFIDRMTCEIASCIRERERERKKSDREREREWKKSREKEVIRPLNVLFPLITICTSSFTECGLLHLFRFLWKKKKSKSGWIQMWIPGNETNFIRESFSLYLSLWKLLLFSLTSYFSFSLGSLVWFSSKRVTRRNFSFPYSHILPLLILVLLFQSLK